MSSNSGRIGHFTLELYALDCQKSKILIFDIRSIEVVFLIRVIKVKGDNDNEDIHKISGVFDFGPDHTSHFGVTCI